MKPNLTRLVSEALHYREPALAYEISRQLADLFPDRTILETEDYDFDLVRYAEEGRCAVHVLSSAHAQLKAEWYQDERGLVLMPNNALVEIQWRGRRLNCLTVTRDDCGGHRHFLIADSERDAHEFFAAVCTASAEVNGEILIYGGSEFRRDRALAAQIAGTTLESLVLPAGLQDQLVADIEGFFRARELYESHGAAWKRGVLLFGPPGNGKTHAIKAMINRTGKPCLYVRSFRPSKGTVHASMEKVFHKARGVAPCFLVLEDLDSLVDDANRSFFLNEMDGFATNAGILTIATTNHPEKLDPAILERPSRFDRKIRFDPPGREDRLRFLRLADERREPAAKATHEDLELLADATKGFSFAYLKEVGLSGLMAWMADPRHGQIGAAMLAQVETLRGQMKKEAKRKSEVAEDEE